MTMVNVRRDSRQRASGSDYAQAVKACAGQGIDPDRAIDRLKTVSLSIHCWQADDVTGFETNRGSAAVKAIRATGGPAGPPMTVGELQGFLERVLSLLPGRHRVNLHAIYGDFAGERVDRDRIRVEHFRSWIEWSRRSCAGLDLNATCFNHPKADDGYTLSSEDPAVRSFWVEHVRRCREIASRIGLEQRNPCLHNLWIPDGSRDVTAARHRRRQLLRGSLDRIYERRYPRSRVIDSLESKLFGIGSEYYQVGSHEFYLGYALKRGLIPCLDLGHFHPTESVADKISGLLPFFDRLALHLSRGVRWDSDHVVVLDDGLLDLCREVVRASALPRVHFALDFFDASMDRTAACVIGGRSVLKALLIALLEPDDLDRLERTEEKEKFLARVESLKGLPWAVVWDHYCRTCGVPTDREWLREI